MDPTSEQLLWMYEKMIEIREYEETMAKVYLEGKLPPKIQKGLAFDIGAGPVPGEMHLAAGQEPVAVGVCAHLRREDTVVGAHRPHHFAIAKDVDLFAMTSEMFGKANGLGKGKGGHMHLFDPAVKFSCSGIVGAGAPQACGAALAAKKLGKDWVAVSFFGEGAANQGSFHEALNLASLWKLPAIFVCEDNKYGISVEKSASTAIASNADRAAGYGMPGVLVDRNDAVAVFEAAGEAVARARRGEGPTLIEVKTDRYLGHFQGDPETYRPKNEAQHLREHDPIVVLGAQLRARGELDDGRDAALRAAISERVQAAYEHGRNSPYPAPEDALLHVFAA
ncbi:thiamine pyrophosphate-dependent dehydrogenase E1 component subunit alpha [Cognatazoarcus halotolerans]|uniref:thiamine pyrophosphate-dependent dehydrogenase E1 component subunit alpha n=1 Tax=Cognatazoarcus halotolerans TaxID=2686016 RepID=UPI001357FBB0|nr:thiamine pyrophosphate-dependent dehydrogenase E1 component subunit alpha [Cognatazoarcus halotolerans]MBX3680840.1 thiamine pyrophosphate-dependent dehydrogenase E1 component subunit alpha [Rhodocyclaceae bacterium]MCP5307823.1 thiamine pyrophosphate-dependent dehydrogenase E1 component subunit alpha [Zoogloeaceae bacterium]